MNTQESSNDTSAFATVFDDSKKSKLALHHYLDQYSLSIKDTEASANFISMAPQYRKRFYVPDDAVPQLMILANTCHREGIVNHLYEIQDVNEVQASGLTFEFKFETDQSKIEFETVVSGFIRILFRDILTRWIAFSEDKEEHYCFYLSTMNPFYDCRTLKYKSMFKIVIPSIMLDADTRYFIYQRVWQSVDMKILFEKKLNLRIRECFMRSMRTAPITLLGSCDTIQLEPLYLESVFRITVEEGTTDGESVSLSSIDSRFNNVIHESSINYPYDGGVVFKSHYLPTDACIKKMEDDCNDQHLFQMAYDEANSTFIRLSVSDRNIEIMNDMVSMLSNDRFVDLDSWLEIIKSLASDGNRYYCIAIMMTKYRSKGLVSWEEFSEYWNDAINSSNRSKYSSKALRYWATCDSPSKMCRYIDQVIKKMLERDVRDSLVQGRIHHSHIASYLQFMFKNVYVTHNVTKSNVHWYEFVTPFSSDIEPGQLYKWRCIGNQPDSLAEFISQDFKDIAVKVHSDLKSRCSSTSESEREDPKVKHAKLLFKAYDKAIVSIFNNGFKRSVIEESTVLFKRNHFIKQLDKTAHILGVGNGVLEFNGPDVKLLNHYHTYPISLFTDTNYVPYDEDSKYVKTVYRMLHSLVPEDEMDALDFILYYFSTSLDWLTKESLFLIVHGGGCHAIDTPIRMFDGSIKMVQDVKVGEKIMGDDNTARTVQELFRGTDDMVRIIPTKGESFVVNKNHVLSLKFTNLCSVQPLGDTTKYQAIWYERNGFDEPTKWQKICNTKDEAYSFIDALLLKNLNIIKDGDIIDIKVCHLLKWNYSWSTNLCLYKYFGELSHFNIQYVGEGQYYGFELDGNHRYLTGDYYVHHNSNGKTVLMELFRRTLGELYARKMPLSFITDQSRTRSSAADPAVMELKDARLVYYSESDRNEKVNVAKVKEITGGETLSGRQLYKEQENFRANCNHIVTTNHRFVIETTEHAVWRRFISYRFKICFKHECDPSNPLERPRDPKLIDTIMNDKRYQEAFLSILIHYRSMLYSKYEGQILKVPHPTIVKETEEYRQSEDIFQRYIMQRVYYYKGRQQSIDELITNFRGYYRIENGEQYKAKSADMIHTFRNSILANHFKESGGLYTLDDMYSCNEHESPLAGSILFSEWIKQKDSLSSQYEELPTSEQ